MNNRVSSLYPRFRDMMESNDYAGLDQGLAGMDALDEEFAEAVKQQIIQMCIRDRLWQTSNP